MHVIQLLPRRWQDFLSNKAEFCTVLRKRFSSVCELSFLRTSCQNEENEMLDFVIIASGLIIRHSRNNCFGRSQLHFILTVKDSSIFFFLFPCNNGKSYLEAWSFCNIFCSLRPHYSLRFSPKVTTRNILWWKDNGKGQLSMYPSKLRSFQSKAIL